MTEQPQPQTRKDIEARIIAKAWKDEAYKQKLLSNSKSVIGQEFNVQLPKEVSVQVMEENPTSLYFVLPARPEIFGQEISDEQLQAIAGGASVDLVKIAAATASYVAASVSAAGGYFAVSKS